MKIIAYIYSNPLLESHPETTMWGWEIDKIYQDLGARVELQQLLKDCQIEPTEYLLIRRLEELGDSIGEICDRISQIEATGVKIIAIAQPYSSLHPQPELLQLLAEIQRETNSRRLREGHAKNRIKTLPPPGKAPYGYRRGKDRYIIDRSTAPVIKDFFEQFLLYGCLRGAVRYLERKYNKKISISTGHRWLTNPVYRGNISYQNGEIISDTHSPILNREEAAQIDRLLRRNRRLPSRTASAPRSLAGLIVCGKCQSHMTVTSVTKPRKKWEYLYLRPINCTNIPKCQAIRYEQVLARTIQSICEELPRAVAQMNMPSLDGIKQSLNDKIIQQKDIIEQLDNLTKTGILDTETAQLRAYKVKTEISQIQARLDALPPVNLKAIAQTVSIPQFWTDLSESERRFYFREFIRQIEITRQDSEWQLQLIFIF